MRRALTIAALTLASATSALAQAQRDPAASYPPGTIVQVQPNATGGSPSLIISRGSTGADTIFTNSAAGGNAGQPERAVPQGSAGGSQGGGR